MLATRQQRQHGLDAREVPRQRRAADLDLDAGVAEILQAADLDRKSVV